MTRRICDCVWVATWGEITRLIGRDGVHPSATSKPKCGSSSLNPIASHSVHPISFACTKPRQNQLHPPLRHHLLHDMVPVRKDHTHHVPYPATGFQTRNKNRREVGPRHCLGNPRIRSDPHVRVQAPWPSASSPSAFGVSPASAAQLQSLVQHAVRAPAQICGQWWQGRAPAGPRQSQGCSPRWWTFENGFCSEYEILFLGGPRRGGV